MDDAKPEIRRFLAQFFGDHQLTDDENIFASGFVNSLFIMQLVLFVENHFGMTVGDEDLEMDNFRSVEAIDALIARKRTAGARS